MADVNVRMFYKLCGKKYELSPDRGAEHVQLIHLFMELKRVGYAKCIHYCIYYNFFIIQQNTTFQQIQQKLQHTKETLQQAKQTL